MIPRRLPRLFDMGLVVSDPAANVAAVAVTPAPAVEDLEAYRRELTGYCYRMLGSASEADDAVQETMVKAWRAADRFEGRSSVRSWLYRIATNVCLDMHRGRARRAMPMDLGPPSKPCEELLGPLRTEVPWVTPIADGSVVPHDGDPAELVAARDTIRVAFVTALQHLPPRQRAALILCEVLRWSAAETAELLETSVAAVNSALQRARASLSQLSEEDRGGALGEDDAKLVEQWVDAFERYDIERLVTLLHDDAVMSMPPFAMWLRGAEDIGRFMLEPGPSACRGSRLMAVEANGCPAFGQYKPDPSGGLSPWSLQVLEISGGRIAAYHAFLDTPEIFPRFGLPAHLS
jgi:RNA polymerase sigma-70 factor (ECF subfamily)